MNDTNLTGLCNLFLALSDKTRLQLIGLMVKGKVSVGFLAESIGENQPKVSRHLAFLRNAGLVSTEREGKNVFYSIEWPQDETAHDVMSAVLGNSGINRNGLEQEQIVLRVENQDILPKTYMTDYVSQEIEVYLL